MYQIRYEPKILQMLYETNKMLMLWLWDQKKLPNMLRLCLVSKKFQDSPSHRILRHMHKILNLDENKN